MQILDVIAALRQFGFSAVAKLLMTIGWFAAPFCFWATIDKIGGDRFFVLIIAIPGLLYVLIGCVLTGAQVHNLAYFEFSLMRRVEHCGQIFQNPADADVAKRYSEECEKLVLPYVYHYPLVMSGGMRELIASKRIVVPTQVMGLYGSYSVFTVLVLYQASTRALLASAMTVPQVSSVVTLLLPWANDNPLWILLLLGIASLCFDTYWVFRFTKREGVPLYKMALIWPLSLLRSDYRLMTLSAQIGRIPTYMRRDQIARYKPFVCPSTLPQVIQQAVVNIEERACSVTCFSQRLENEGEVQRVVKLFKEDPRIPRLLKFLVPKNTGQIMEMTEKSHPVFYLGTLNDRCLMIANIIYNPHEKAREGFFYFDNAHIRNEFKQIMTKEIEKLRVVMVGVPSAIEDILERMRGQTGAE